MQVVIVQSSNQQSYFIFKGYIKCQLLLLFSPKRIMYIEQEVILFILGSYTEDCICPTSCVFSSSVNPDLHQPPSLSSSRPKSFLARCLPDLPLRLLPNSFLFLVSGCYAFAQVPCLPKPYFLKIPVFHCFMGDCFWAQRVILRISKTFTE